MSEQNGDDPQFFRMNIETASVDEAADFYGELLGLEGRKQAGARVYFDCGPVTLQWLTCPAFASRTRPQRRSILRSTILTVYFQGQKNSIASRPRAYTERRPGR